MPDTVSVIALCDCGKPITVEVKNTPFAITIAKNLVIHDKTCRDSQEES